MITFKEYLMLPADQLEEMEQKMPAWNERNKHYANQFDKEIIQKGGRDALTSQPNSKRYNQRKERDRRRFDGPEDELEAKMPANRDRKQREINNAERNEQEANDMGSMPNIDRRLQRARRSAKSRYGIHHKNGS